MSSILNRLVEPADPKERAAAIRICRLNAYLDPETGAPQQDREAYLGMFDAETPDLPIAKWLWMWNHGRDEWDGAGSQARFDADQAQAKRNIEIGEELER